MNYYIYKLHSLNLFYIWFLGLFKVKVIYHQCALKNKSIIPKNCRQVDDYKNTDQWIDCLEKSYYEVRSFFEKNKIRRRVLPRSTSEMLAKKYEDLKCFESLCFKDKDYLCKKSIICMPFFSESKLFNSFQYKTSFFTLLDSMNDGKENLIEHLKHFYIILVSFNLSKKYFQIENVISGITQSEIPTSSTSLNAFWLTEQNILNCEHTVYYVPSLSGLNNVKPNSIILNHASICSQISIGKRLWILISKLACIIRLILCFDIEKRFELTNLFMMQTWSQFHKATQFKNFVTNISELWPCSSNVEILNNLGVKTILWSYSYYGARASMYKKFTGKCLNISFATFSHIFLWDQKLVDLFRECEINPLGDEFTKNYYVSGPLINGSISHFDYAQDEALSLLNLTLLNNKIIISVFDLPAWKNEIRRDKGFGLFSNLEVQESFYRGIYEIVRSNKNIIILVKSKRKSGNTMLPIWFNNLSEIHERDQVIFMDESTSPVLLVKASDVVITTPFTSPSMIANLCGISNFYYDPSNTFNFISICENKIFNTIPNGMIKKTKIMRNKCQHQVASFTKNLKSILAAD